ncbi:hypothetical protein QAD02_021862 [Eretmocerus hayati]|uniref:Uncharacterized protein n=1 Tax=Eretmocerus hayati TaxID=131215 RepID=A0ACC2PSU5_9HYME|nr:hypothetical protein QAD02_021862 [Eretmocerus hayati]
MAAAEIKKRKSSDIESVISGYRIVDLRELGRNLKCLACGTVLSLENIVSEKLLGLHSVLSVKCHPCGIITPVATGRTDGRFADINKVIVLGAIHSGAGCVTVNKILATTDIPGLPPPTHKRYERIVGPSAGLEVRVVIGNEDSSTMASAHAAATGMKIFKLADKNHLVKKFGKELYELAKVHKELGRKGVIDHIEKELQLRRDAE